MNPTYKFLLRLGDDSLILGQRLAELCGHGPILEEDIALTNISLDLIGQATNIYNYAAEIEGQGRDADALAFLRLEHQYFNVVLVEQANGNFADTMVRQFLFDAFRKLLFEHLLTSSDIQLAAIAEKSLKETKYHLKHSSEWLIRLGDGTVLSHERAQMALFELWRYSDELFYMDETEKQLASEGVIPNLTELKSVWLAHITSIVQMATLELPTQQAFFGAGRQGRHSEHMGFILAQLQYMQRTYPNMQW